ncbi:chalcone isomerase family protein [Actimicrobium antarcticum]|uniref:Chalcone isomerase family protein n=1 Tax=Actimicrobium antarcticum TaxID=1051899 RepID=A0ABP7T8H6_9BURK
MIARRLLALFLGLLLALPVFAATPAHIRNDVPDARLSGQGTFRWFGLHIYDAALWVGAKGYDLKAPLALDLTYARALAGKKIAEASDDEIRKLGLGTPEQQATWLAKMTALFPDVQDGTHITGVYLPALGARFYHDGKLLGEIADPAFARAFFAIWLDPKTSAGKLRDALLMDAAPR